MIIQSEDFIRTMLNFFPSTQADYDEITLEYYEGQDTVIIEDIFMPKVLELLYWNNDTLLLKKIFSYFEDVSCYGEKCFIDDFSVTVLEKLGNDRKILKIAQEYMGPRTMELQIQADMDLGRV